MSFEAVREFGLSLPEAWEDHPWGETALKVRKKVFVFLWRDSDTQIMTMTVKLPLSGAEVLERSQARPAGYGLGKSGWVTLRLEPDHPVPAPELVAWVAESYRAVAPKTLGRQVEL